MRLPACALSALAAVFAALPGNVQAADVDTVSFCYNDWKPYAAEVDGEAFGLSIDILREAASRAGLQPRFRSLPWKRCLSAVESGEVDAVVDALERPEFVHGDIAFTFYTNTFWVRGDDPVGSLDAALGGGRRLGLVAGYVYGEALDALFAASGAPIDEAVDDGTNLRKLAFRRVDVVVADFASTLVFARDEGLSLRPLKPTHSVDRLYTSFNPQREALMERLDEALRDMCEEGWIEAQYVATLGIGLDAITGNGTCMPEADGKETG